MAEIHEIDLGILPTLQRMGELKELPWSKYCSEIPLKLKLRGNQVSVSKG